MLERGRKIRRKLSDEIRTETNDAFPRVAALRGEAKEVAYHDLYLAYCMAAACTENGDVMLANAAACALLNKQ